MKQKKPTQEIEKKSHSTTSLKNFKVNVTQDFIKEAKELKKDYPNIGDDFLRLKDELKKDPTQGDNLGGGLFKTRMAVSDKGKGKRSGARVVVWVKIFDKVVYVLAVYSKSESDTAIISAMKSRIEALGL